jgi:hypothetical protein
MAILFQERVLSKVINDIAGTYYSDPDFDLTLGNAEAFYAEVKASNVLGANPWLDLSIESSNDRVTWFVRTALILNKVNLGASPVWAGKVINNSGDSAAVQVGGCYTRFGVKLNNAGSSAYVELFVEGRDGA